MDKELSLCPFCGEKMLVVSVDGIHYWVGCDNWKCMMYSKTFVKNEHEGN